MSGALSTVPRPPEQQSSPVAIAAALAEDFSQTAADHDKAGNSPPAISKRFSSRVCSAW